MKIEHVKLLFERFETIWLHKFIKDFDDEKLILVWLNDWADGLKNQNNESIKKAIDHCKLNLEWPPSLAEFISICEKLSGVPTCEEAFQLALRKDFTHPIVKESTDKVGSFAMRNDKEEILKKKFEKAYNDTLSEFRSNPSDPKFLIETRPANVLPLHSSSTPTNGNKPGVGNKNPFGWSRQQIEEDRKNSEFWIRCHNDREYWLKARENISPHGRLLCDFVHKIEDDKKPLSKTKAEVTTIKQEPKSISSYLPECMKPLDGIA